ncbi:triple tyrosine motif-containing protein [Croceitalea marina]|uniref:Triple tyrosine motif-containing protein n=1 Tax=Croceitalea marina TaxID=1775166 RepID=A0ABW5MRU9_9FLAO
MREQITFVSILALFLLNFKFVSAQENYPIQNFLPSEYDGENQNWSISQSADKLIYVANSKGLLEFNGASWALYPSPNETIMRSVKVVEDRIYTGSFMEFGYWTKNNFGTLEYTSLSKNINVDLIEDEEFWNIISIDEYIVFQSLKRIYIYNINENTLNTIESNSTITKMFKVGQKIYFQRIDKGLYKIESGKDFLVFEDDIVRNDEVINLFGNEEALLILTKNNGFYELVDEGLIPSSGFPNAFLADFSLYDGLQLDNGNYVLGTIADGFVYLSDEGELLSQIDQNSSLSNNTVLSLFEDLEHNIWLGLDYGISYINIDSPYKVYNDTRSSLGSVYASAIHNNNLYLGTNQGLFYKKLDGKNDFSFIPGTQGQVWCLEVIDDSLFCGHNSGTYMVNANQAKKVSNVQGTWKIAKLTNRPHLLLQGNYDGLYVLEKLNNTWQLKNKIKGFDNSSRYFETLGNQIFVNHEYNGVFELTVNDSFSAVENVRIDTIIKGSNSGIVKYNGDLLYAYKKGILKYNRNKKGFFKDSLLSSIYNESEYESGKLVVDNNANRLWVFNQSNISYVSPDGLTNTPKIKSIPLTKEMRDGILGYENIINLDNQGNYLLGNTSGYIVINTNALRAKSFEVKIDEVSNGGIYTDKKNYSLISDGSYNSKENDFNFSFYAPEYNKFSVTQYQYRLLGRYEQWSEWSAKAEVLYENLPPGDYVFEVKGKIGNDLSKNKASYSFEIAKPWYISNVMVVLYVLGVLLFSFFMHNMYKRYYKKQREKLIEKNKRELEFTQIRSEKEIIRIKNEQLELENKSKGKELAASTMSIIKKNELLSTIKEELNKIADQEALKPVVKIIDKSLKRNDDWELFQEAFNNADSEFLKKVKNLHPSLSPNDLKLCAYLRLNLSSKEIAQLLHISPRSVEIKRYRLRKKLDLKHEENLVNYILGL